MKIFLCIFLLFPVFSYGCGKSSSLPFQVEFIEGISDSTAVGITFPKIFGSYGFTFINLRIGESAIPLKVHDIDDQNIQSVIFATEELLRTSHINLSYSILPQGDVVTLCSMSKKLTFDHLVEEIAHNKAIKE